MMLREILGIMQSSDVYELAQLAGARIVRARWPLVTVGEWSERTREIRVNLAAVEMAAARGLAAEKVEQAIIAHELGHVFAARAGTLAEREAAARDFAARLAGGKELLETLESIWRVEDGERLSRN